MYDIYNVQKMKSHKISLILSHVHQQCEEETLSLELGTFHKIQLMQAIVFFPQFFFYSNTLFGINKKITPTSSSDDC